MSTKKSKKQTSSAEQRPAKRPKIMSLAEYEAGAKAEKKTAPGGAGSKTPAKLPKDATAAEKPATRKRRGTSRGLGGLDAAAKVLAEAGEPLNCKTIVDRMLAKGLWQTDGKTPQATIYSALLRHIQKNGAASLFRKVERGRFELVR